MKVTYKNWTFSASQTESAETVREQSLNCESVSADSLTAVVRCTNSSIMAFALNDPVKFWEDDSEASVQTYYLRSITRTGSASYKLVAWSAAGLLATMAHKGGMYTGETVQQVVREICGDIPALVKTSYAGTKLYGWLPYANGKDRSARDNLAQVLFAVGGYLRTDLDGVLRIEPLWDGTASVIGAGRSYTGGTVRYDSPVSSVAVTEHQYTAGTEEKELFSGPAQQGDIITFSEPMHSLTATGFSILESGANYAKLSAGTGTLKGRAYIHNTRIVTQTVTPGAAENVKSFATATLVSLVNSVAVAKRLAEYFRCRETVTNGIVSGNEKPGHVVSVYHPYDKKMVQACIQSLDTTVSGTLKSEMTALVGFAPPQPDTSEYYDTRIVLTGSGEWTAPDNVSGSMTVVVIGAGAGGWSGLPGGDSEAQTVGTETKTLNNLTLRDVGVTWVKAGDGGAGGEGGDGGRVLQETITVTPGQTISYRCGVGGEGGAFDAAGSQQGAAGGDSVFGSVSSARGATVPGGWQDVITGEIYAGPGTSGIAGSRGHYKKIIDGVVHDYPSPTITANGTTYTQGADGGSAADGHGNEQTPPYGYLGWQYNGACGGGPAYGANGRSGGTGEGRVDSKYDPTWAFARSGFGGWGATALPPDKETARYGQGGRGGNGGGGGGSPGRASAEQNTDKDMSGREDARLTAAGSRGYGGDGSAGGQGADGCIILYLRQARRSVSGWAKDSNDRWRLDRLGRRCIV